ncbi:helix-turn-helix domain-containing protein [Bradyrhizobium jicamae]|uniref:helix-turn-helix domain-containing protein n=1 Tax=Bradyrhizobium jicamae TaxID=280332 RepID=UPI001BA475F4|nr:helix-turn-helix domain-containing protein [Bradyrhizobium jicamae]MBR0753472.1 helix-turn-helix domain-containing protein [Bradyrhizobium jicamae]
MQDKAYARRHSKAAAISRMFLTLSRIMSRTYPHQKNVGQLLPEILIIMACRVNDERKRPPASFSQIARITGMPRTNVRRLMPSLIAAGVLEKSGSGYIGSPAYIRSRINARYFRRVLIAVQRCARELEALEK